MRRGVKVIGAIVSGMSEARTLVLGFDASGLEEVLTAWSRAVQILKSFRL